MLTIKEVIELALSRYNKRSFMCHEVEELDIDSDDINKTLDFIKSQIHGSFTLTNFLTENVPEYDSLCKAHSDDYESKEPFDYRVKWWKEVIKLPEAQV